MSADTAAQAQLHHVHRLSIRLLGSVFVAMVLTMTPAARAAGPVRIADPALPGPDVPERGGSLLDALTLDERGRRQIPFPFERLVQRLDAAAGCNERDTCTRAVLIPLGRSLQRVAASPDFFANPRVVLAVTEQRNDGMPLRDRLFLGYQPAEGLIEVISYNDAVGRFEFQLIKNYRAGATPQVFQARRAVCVSCHQNHAPIFSRQLWSETNANPQIAQRLSGDAFNGVSVAATTEIPNAIDAATDRANSLVMTQMLWRAGCGAGTAGERCRLAALRAALQLALAGERGYASERLQMDDALSRTAKDLWPDGLAIPNPDLANRDPLVYPPGARGAEVTHVPASLEPLMARTPLAVIEPEGDVLADALVRGIATTWSSERIAKLDAALAHRRATHREIAVPCRVANERVRTFECRGTTKDAIRLSGSFDGSSVTLDALEVGGGAPLRHVSSKLIRREAHKVVFAPQDRGRSARLISGNAVERVTLEWSATGASASISIREDFTELFDAAPASITNASLPELLDAAIAHASDTIHVPCCTIERNSAQIEPMSAVRLTGLAAAFEPHCGACHRTPDASPPNFLSGDQTEVERQIEVCAPRIFVRLAMTGLPPNERDKTPMPPGTGAADVRAMKALVSLQARLQPFLRKQYGRVPALDELLASGYERLPPCRVASTTH